MTLLCQIQKWELLHIQAFNKVAVHQCFWKATEVFQSLLCPSVSLHTQWNCHGGKRGKLSQEQDKKTFSMALKVIWVVSSHLQVLGEQCNLYVLWMHHPHMTTLMICWWTSCGLRLPDHWIVPTWCSGADILLEFIAAIKGLISWTAPMPHLRKHRCKFIDHALTMVQVQDIIPTNMFFGYVLHPIMILTAENFSKTAIVCRTSVQNYHILYLL